MKSASLLGLGLVVTAVVLRQSSNGAAAGPCAPSGELDADETRLVELVNNYRAEHGLGALQLSPTLSRAATWMGEDMAARGYFSHTDSLGRAPYNRAIDCGYPSGAGENLAAGYPTPEAAFEGWKASPGHNANMLTSDYRVIGVAVVRGGQYGTYWVTNFGLHIERIVVLPFPYRLTLSGVAREVE